MAIQSRHASAFKQRVEMAIETDPEEVGDQIPHQEWDACVSTWTYQLSGVFRRDVCGHPRVGRAGTVRMP